MNRRRQRLQLWLATVTTAGPPESSGGGRVRDNDHIARQCPQPMRVQNSAWFMEKMLLAQVLEAGIALSKKQLAILANIGDRVDSHLDNEITSDSNIIPYSQCLLESQQTAVQDTNSFAQQDSMILSVIEKMSEQMINHVTNWDKAKKEANSKSLTAELERYKERVKTFE
ncbi:hypothetical protein Tco_0703135 [Tanacetum coccineum]|uniref:Uncharacterized protein n=1 Tax=Tanacetum coccineum TaxID=301880 RepID=A0ABQ4XXY2_9ASTR